MDDSRTLEVHTFRCRLEPERLLYRGPGLDRRLASEWDVESGEWRTSQDGVTGTIREERAAVLWHRGSFPRDISLTFRGRAVGERGLDINCYWNGNGRIYSGPQPRCTIAVVGGWWAGKCGLEKFPEGTLTAATDFFPVERGRWHEITAGRLLDWSFLFVDGVKILELHDPDPIDPERYPRIALSTWNSSVEFADLCVHALEAPSSA
jgi:hypothetical protein